ncbi:Uncharacterised protein [Candidatus Bilamarchaeum dharawalense]|uniref:Uncharacterized protein n=1 Tax=Candidatus Bilamarchaeum dharawalense TaxID=2885759 RepID=A0A5E4LRU8_9ARCH|nr:Uncharacterised protein [Candidatus Bilamarchaeum dharawalense]
MRPERPLKYNPHCIDPSVIARSLAYKWGMPFADPIVLPKQTPKPARIFEVGQVPKKFTTLDPNATIAVESSERTTAELLVKRYDTYIRELMAQNPEAFRIREVINIQDGWVAVGSPINIGYQAIPVFVHVNGETRLNFAYRSKSQESWRRFVGEVRYIDNEGKTRKIYWKGENEHLQNFDWDIQKTIDAVYAKAHTLHVLSHGRSCMLFSLQQLGINAVAQGEYELQVAENMIKNAERMIQNSMKSGAPPLDFQRPEDKPSTLVGFWWSGDKKEGAYGRHLNFVVSTKFHDLCIAVTDEGLFMKYAQAKNPPGINIVGAPVRGAVLSNPMSFLLTPIVEYAEYVEKTARERKLDGARGVRVQDTVSFDMSHGTTRKRILGLHDDPSSPLFELNAGLWRVYRLMREERYQEIDAFLESIRSNGRILPLADHLPMRVVHADSGLVTKRYDQLSKALDKYIDLFLELPSGESDIAQRHRASLMLEFDLTSRELTALTRYTRFVITQMQRYGYGSDDYASNPDYQKALAEKFQRVRSHLDTMADRWARDQEESTHSGSI